MKNDNYNHSILSIIQKLPFFLNNKKITSCTSSNPGYPDSDKLLLMNCLWILKNDNYSHSILSIIQKLPFFPSNKKITSWKSSNPGYPDSDRL